MAAKVAAGIGVIAVVALAVALVIRWRTERNYSQIARGLEPDEAPSRAFDPETLSDLPEPARRYLHHAIEPGAALARTVHLEQRGRMRPSPEAEMAALTSEERLTPGVGFVWHASLKIKGLPVEVWDHYATGEGSVKVMLLGSIPIETSTGADVSRSARHRLAAESLWVPSALLPGPGVEWEPIDEDRARVVLTVDGEEIPLTYTVGPDGALQSFRMQRYGDVGDEPWELIPYGFEVVSEGSFDGYTIPTKVRGGWWFGDGSYEPEDHPEFEILSATFD